MRFAKETSAMCYNLQEAISNVALPPPSKTTSFIIYDPPTLRFLSCTRLLAVDGGSKLTRLPQDHTSKVARFWNVTELGTKLIKRSKFHTSRVSRF